MGLAKGLKSMGDAKVFKGILAMAALAPAMILFLPAIPGLFLITGLGALAPLLVGGFTALKQGFGILGKGLTEIAKGSLAMAIMGASLIPFAYAATMMSDVDWLNVLAGVGVATLVIAGLAALGLVAVAAIPLIGLASIALLMAGGALLGFGLMMGSAGPLIMSALIPLQAITEQDWSGLSTFAGAITLLGVGLLVGSAGFVLGVMALSYALPTLAAMTPMLIGLAQQDWSGLITFAQGLYAMAPAMMSFGLASMFFANPLTMLGLWSMTSSMSELQGVMANLTPNMTEGAKGTMSMAEGVAKLQDSISELDIDKLWALQEVLEEAAGS